MALHEGGRVRYDGWRIDMPIVAFELYLFVRSENVQKVNTHSGHEKRNKRLLPVSSDSCSKASVRKSLQLASSSAVGGSPYTPLEQIKQR